MAKKKIKFHSIEKKKFLLVAFFHGLSFRYYFINLSDVVCTCFWLGLLWVLFCGGKVFITCIDGIYRILKMRYIPSLLLRRGNVVVFVFCFIVIVADALAVSTPNRSSLNEHFCQFLCFSHENEIHWGYLWNRLSFFTIQFKALIPDSKLNCFSYIYCLHLLQFCFQFDSSAENDLCKALF